MLLYKQTSKSIISEMFSPNKGSFRKPAQNAYDQIIKYETRTIRQMEDNPIKTCNYICHS